jgi:hypothetical protein
MNAPSKYRIVRWPFSRFRKSETKNKYLEG